MAVPSVWAVVSAYLHSGVAASEAAPEPIRGSAGERVAQVRDIFQSAAPAVPSVERGTTCNALRALFSRTEGSEQVESVEPVEVIDLRDHRGGSEAHGHREPCERAASFGHGDHAEIDLRDPAPADVSRRPVQHYATMRRDSVDDAVVRWYTARHHQQSALSR